MSKVITNLKSSNVVVGTNFTSSGTSTLTGNVSLGDGSSSTIQNLNQTGTMHVIASNISLEGSVSATSFSTTSLSTTGQRISGKTVITSNTTLTSAHNIVLIKTASSSITATLPSCSTATGYRYLIMKSADSDSNNAIISVAGGGDKIDGSLTTVTLASLNEKIELICPDGLCWYSV